MKSARLNAIILLLLVMAGCESQSVTPELTLDQAWVRAMPPGAGMTAAYGRFTNNTESPIKIGSLSSDSYADVSLHKTVTEAGVSRMEHIKNWQLEPGSTFSLQPGGAHLMLMKPLHEVNAGDEVAISLTSTSGRIYEFTFPVLAR